MAGIWSRVAWLSLRSSEKKIKTRCVRKKITAKVALKWLKFCQKFFDWSTNLDRRAPWGEPTSATACPTKKPICPRQKSVKKELNRYVMCCTMYCTLVMSCLWFSVWRLFGVDLSCFSIWTVCGADSDWRNDGPVLPSRSGLERREVSPGFLRWKDQCSQRRY